MYNYSINRIKLQINYMNSLLENRNTPKGKIEIEKIMLANMLDNFDISRAKALEYEIRSVYQALKQLQKKLNNIGGCKNE